MTDDVGDVAGKVRSLTAAGCPASTAAPSPSPSLSLSPISTPIPIRLPSVVVAAALVMTALHYYNCRHS